MMSSTHSRTWVRAVNALFALAVCAVVVGNYLPMWRAIGLARADLGIQGEWIGNEAKQITAVQTGGAADRAGLQPGDVLQFDSHRETDWVLAGYRHMPEGFRGSVPVRHADGSTSSVVLVPERVAYLPGLNDKLALCARLAGTALGVLIGVFMVWMRPGLMTWSLLLMNMAGFPVRPFADYYLGFDARPGVNLLYFLPPVTQAWGVAILPFALTFPRNVMKRWPWWGRGALLLVALGWLALLLVWHQIRAFHGPVYDPDAIRIWLVVDVLVVLAAIATLTQTYRRSDGPTRARLRWALLGICVAMANLVPWLVFWSAPAMTADTSVGNQLTAGHWLVAVTIGVLFPVSFGYAVLRERVVDVQFAVSRTVVYGIVSTVVLVFLAVLHWLLGRMIEHSRLAFGLEGLAAVGLGLVLHRASHGINTTVDRVLFRKHHAAEERLRQVTAALPYASTERSIAEALVNEPVHNLQLASAALFYRDSPEGPLRRVRSEGWGEEHPSSLDPESFLVRYLQAEHTAVRLDDEQQWLPPRMPEGTAHPVLAIPIVSQHALSAVVLYGSHLNGTIPDPDEVELLAALANAAATSHQQVRIATLSREVETHRVKNEQLEASFRVLAQGRVGAPPVKGTQ